MKNGNNKKRKINVGVQMEVFQPVRLGNFIIFLHAN